MKNVGIQLEIISKEEKWWAKLSFENFSGKSIWLDEQKLFGESLKSNLFSIKNSEGVDTKYIGFQVNSSTKKYTELKDKETKVSECNLSKAYKIEKDAEYTLQYVQPVAYLNDPLKFPETIAETLDSGIIPLNAKEIAATLSIKNINGLLTAELEFKNNSKRDIWLDVEAVGGTKVLKQNIFKIITEDGEECRFKNLEISRANTEEDRFVKIAPKEFFWTRNNISSKYDVPKNESISVQYNSAKAYGFLKPVEDDKDTLLPISSNIVKYTHHAVTANIDITQDADTIYANLTFVNHAKTNVWLNTKYLGSEDLEYNVFTFQDENGMPTFVQFKPKITTHEYEYDVDHFIELAPGDNLQTQVNLNRNYVLDEQGKYLIKYEAPALMWKQPKELKDYDEFSEDDDEPYFDNIASERVKLKIDDAGDPIKIDFDVFVKKDKAYAKLTITALKSKPVFLNTRQIGGDMLGNEIFEVANDFGLNADWINPKHDDGNEETISLEKGDSFSTETCLNQFYEIQKGEKYNVKLWKHALGIDLKQWDEEKNVKSFMINADKEEPQGPLQIQFKHDYELQFSIVFMNKSKKSLWINGAVVSPEGTKNITVRDGKNNEINRTQKPENYINWMEIIAGDSYENSFDISYFYKVKEGNTYSLHYKGLTYTLTDPYQFDDDKKVKLQEVCADSKLFETD